MKDWRLFVYALCCEICAPAPYRVPGCRCRAHADLEAYPRVRWSLDVSFSNEDVRKAEIDTLERMYQR